MKRTPCTNYRCIKHNEQFGLSCKYFDGAFTDVEIEKKFTKIMFDGCDKRKKYGVRK